MRKRSARLRKRKVGLALGGGAARGLAHIGVLEVLQREGIPIDMIAGTSTGALIGALCAQKKSCGLVKNLAMGIDWKRMVSLVDPVLPKTGLVGGRKVTNLLRQIIGNDIKFDDLEIPLACVATDIITGEEVIIKQGSVLEGIRASISIPGIFTVINWKGRYLVDGQLVNPVPVSVVKEMGADFIIAVNVIPDTSEIVYQMDKEGKQNLKKPNIFSILLQSIYIAISSLAESSLEGADIVIHPEVVHIHYGEFHRAQECILRGELAAQASLPEIKRLLGAC